MEETRLQVAWFQSNDKKITKKNEIHNSMTDHFNFPVVFPPISFHMDISSHVLELQPKYNFIAFFLKLMI